MENIRWRKTLSGASSSERLVILAAERAAKEICFSEAYNERCEEAGSILVDSCDLAVWGASTIWGRKAGYLYCRITVYGRSARRLRVFNWRLPVPGRANKRFKPLGLSAIDFHPF